VIDEIKHAFSANYSSIAETWDHQQILIRTFVDFDPGDREVTPHVGFYRICEENLIDQRSLDYRSFAPVPSMTAIRGDAHHPE
jgi:hypothetical protein